VRLTAKGLVVGLHILSLFYPPKLLRYLDSSRISHMKLDIFGDEVFFYIPNYPLLTKIVDKTLPAFDNSGLVCPNCAQRPS
jgi:hypothetical protein